MPARCGQAVARPCVVALHSRWTHSSARDRRGKAGPVAPQGPKWRNGRRRGFKIPRPRGLVGSSPTLGTSASFFSITRRMRRHAARAARRRSGRSSADCRCGTGGLIRAKPGIPATIPEPISRRKCPLVPIFGQERGPEHPIVRKSGRSRRDPCCFRNRNRMQVCGAGPGPCKDERNVKNKAGPYPKVWGRMETMVRDGGLKPAETPPIVAETRSADIIFPMFFPLFDVLARLKPSVPDWGAQD